jgi:hypothetical protein
VRRQQKAASQITATATGRMTRRQAAKQGVEVPEQFATPPDVARGRRRAAAAPVISKPVTRASAKTPNPVEDDDQESVASSVEQSSPLVRISVEAQRKETLPSNTITITSQSFISRLLTSPRALPTPVITDNSEPSVSAIETPSVSHSKPDIAENSRVFNARALKRKREVDDSVPETNSAPAEEPIKRPRLSFWQEREERKARIEEDLQNSMQQKSPSTPIPQSGFLSNLRSSLANSASKLMSSFPFTSLAAQSEPEERPPPPD